MKKLSLYLLTALGTIVLVGAGIASASQMTERKNVARLFNPPDEATMAQHKAEMIAELASTAGIDATALQTELDSGRWMPAILQDMGVDLDTFHTNMEATRKTQMQERLAQMVTDGTITQAQADARLAQIEQMPDSGMPMGPGHGRHGQGMGFGLNSPSTDQ